MTSEANKSYNLDMVRLIIVRHSMTEWNINNKVQGRSDIPLSAKGRVIAEERKGGLDGIAIDAVYSSPLSRAVETAEIMTDRTPICDERLTEREFGIYDGTSYIALDESTRAKLFCDMKDIAGAEQSEEIFARTRSFLTDIKAKHNGQTVAVFSHAVSLSYLVYAVSHEKFSTSDYEVTYLENCTKMEISL